MKNRWIALVLALTLLTGAGCGAAVRTEDNPPEEKDGPSRPATVAHEAAEEEPPEEGGLEEGPEALPEETELVWCTDPLLTENEMPGSYQGLELPVTGATGYTSIVLPLWASQEDCEAARQAVEEWRERQAAAAEQEDPPAAEGEAPAADPEPLAETDLFFAQNEENPPESDAAEPPSDSGAESAPDAAPADGEPQLPGEGEEEAPQEAEEPPAPSDEETVEPAEEQPQPSEEAEPAEPAEPTLPPEELEPEEEPSLTDGALAILPAGTAMTVLREEGAWWQVSCEAKYITGDGGTAVGEVTGWVTHRYCMINLPDVIPSIVYNATNAYSSLFRTCGKEIDGITGKQLYSGPAQNRRLGQAEFMMPVLYSMAPRLCAAQRAALREGNTLVLYEGYRPQETQLKVAGAVQKMMKQDPEIQTALSTKPWSIPWFIATSTSNHQWGYAVDVTLARVLSVEVHQAGDYAFTRVTEYKEYGMPTQIHELSPAAAIFTEAIGPNSKTAWKSATRTDTFAASESALGLQAYCTDAGLSPLASEWWHFNDLDSRANVLDNLGKGDFTITVCRSTAPR